MVFEDIFIKLGEYVCACMVQNHAHFVSVHVSVWHFYMPMYIYASACGGQEM